MLGPGWRVRAEGATVVAWPASGDGRRREFPTAHLDEEFRGLPRQQRAAYVAEVAEQVAAAFVERDTRATTVLRDFAWCKPRLYPCFISPNQDPRFAGLSTQRPGLPGLATGYVVLDAAARMILAVMEEQRLAWGMDEPDLHRVAMRNLARHRLTPRPHGRDPSCLLAGKDADGCIAAVQVLLPGQMEGMAALCRAETLRVALPGAEAAVAWKAGFPGEAVLLSTVRRLHRESAYPLLGEPLTWEGGRWAVLGGPLRGPDGRVR